MCRMVQGYFTWTWVGDDYCRLQYLETVQAGSFKLLWK